jgi:hypothetical protein
MEEDPEIDAVTLTKLTEIMELTGLAEALVRRLSVSGNALAIGRFGEMLRRRPCQNRRKP